MGEGYSFKVDEIVQEEDCASIHALGLPSQMKVRASPVAPEHSVKRRLEPKRKEEFGKYHEKAKSAGQNSEHEREQRQPREQQPQPQTQQHQLVHAQTERLEEPSEMV